MEREMFEDKIPYRNPLGNLVELDLNNPQTLNRGYFAFSTETKDYNGKPVSHPIQFYPFQVQDLACCGLKEVSSNVYTLYFSKKTFYKWLQSRFQGEYKVTGGLLIATATLDQGHYQYWLKVMGFEFIKEFHNHNSGHTVRMFHFTLPKSFPIVEEEEVKVKEEKSLKAKLSVKPSKERS